MNIIEKEATRFAKDLYLGKYVNNLTNIKDLINTKLYDFSRNRDKLDLLKILRQETIKQLEEHKPKCRGGICRFEEEREIGLFAIDQEIDTINSYYTFEPPKTEAFNSSLESELHSKLNVIIENLEKLGFGQEIIFDEIESLKNHFNLGKKTWFQLLKGKLLDLMAKKLLDKEVANDIYKNLSEGFEGIVNQLNP